MAIRTPFNQTAIAPQPFNLGNIPVHNLTQVPVFLQKGYVNGSTPEALPARGFKPQSSRGFLSRLVPAPAKKK